MMTSPAKSGSRRSSAPENDHIVGEQTGERLAENTGRRPKRDKYGGETEDE
jgi:hypothetical protein